MVAKKDSVKIEEKLKKLLAEASGAALSEISLELPGELSHGDYSSNIALILGKKLGKNPHELAGEIVGKLNENLKSEPIVSAGAEKVSADIEKVALDIEKITAAGPGFINFYLSKQFFASEVGAILKQKTRYGRNDALKGKKIIVEYTDPNPFKAFHIGHLMSNAIGESLSRLIEAEGADVVRANYQGDVGLHVAKAIYGMMIMQAEMPSAKSAAKSDTAVNGYIAAIVAFLGNAYATGSKLYEKDDETKAKINEINKKIYDKSDKEINKLYDFGRKWSLKHFEEIYRILGTYFDYYFFESEVAGEGKRLVEENIRNGIFEVSNGATIFRGEKHAAADTAEGKNAGNLHTRVFITKEGLPTYETKEIGITKKKFDIVHPDLSIVITADEQTHYFHVVIKAIQQIDPEMAAKMRHVAHGMLVLPTGKMSSRTGDVITGESLINDTIARVREKMAETKKSKGGDGNDGGESAGSGAVVDTDGRDDNDTVATQVAVGAIKYMILRQSPGKNIIYDVEKSLSLEGDSGPYLQYATVRAKSVVEKATSLGIKASPNVFAEESVTDLEKSLTHDLHAQLVRFPYILAKAQADYSPSTISTYLIMLAATFNTFYANADKIADADNANSPYKVALTAAFAQVMENGLSLLGIEVPERM